MNCKKEIILTGYRVQLLDLREPKPRTVHEDTYTVDKAWSDAAAMMHLDVTEVIKARYEKGGYRVISLERIGPKRVVTLDLNRLFTEAATTPEEVNG